MPNRAHIPSLTHLRRFARARALGRIGNVAADRRQVASLDGRQHFAFAYERFLTATLRYVSEGNRGPALDQATSQANARMRASYAAAAAGMKQILRQLQPVGARRQQRNIVAYSQAGEELVSLRAHLGFELQDGSELSTHVHFPDERLTPVEIEIVETALALATRSASATSAAGILLVRQGNLHCIDLARAMTPSRVAVLTSISRDYREEWGRS